MRNSWCALAAGALLSSACARAAPHSDAAPIPSASAPPAPASALPGAPPEPAPPDVAAAPADAEHSPSGVASKRLSAGQGGAPPQPNDCVRVRYSSWKRDGSLHASTARDALPATQCLQRTMPGLAEAVQHMSVGEARRIWVPGRLTYHSNDAGEPAPTDDLTFDLTLLEILRAPPVPKDLRAPPPSATKTASGLRLNVLAKGRGPRQARPNERMTVRFTGWTRDGVLFESTELGAGPPASLSRADVTRGLGEGLSLMQIGEKARVWLPAALAFGDQPRRGAPAGDLVYDLELLAVE